MRSLRALRGLRSLTSYALNDAAEVSARSLTTVPDLKSVLKEKIPEQQVRDCSLQMQPQMCQKTIASALVHASLDQRYVDKGRLYEPFTLRKSCL